MSTEFSLDGHVAVVTGGNRGIGLGLASHLAEAGAAVALWSRDCELNDAAVERIRSAGGIARSYECDVQARKEVDNALKATVRDLGSVDSFFANAGIGGDSSAFVDTPLEVWRNVINVNLEGTFLTVQAATRSMIAAGTPGSIVAVSSVSTVHGAPRAVPYAASKGAIGAMVKALSVELARYGIRVNSIVPGWIEVERTSQAMNTPRFSSKVMPRIPLRRWGTPSDIGPLAVYLAGPASSYVTGASFVIDGGYTVF